MRKSNYGLRALAQFRRLSLAEGWSYLLLLLVAMPLKYGADWPYAVKYLGWLHGLLFVLYCGYVVALMLLLKWSFKRGFVAVLAALLPFGPFVFDRSLREEELALAQGK